MVTEIRTYIRRIYFPSSTSHYSTKRVTQNLANKWNRSQARDSNTIHIHTCMYVRMYIYIIYKLVLSP